MRTAYHEALEATRLDVVRLGALAADAIHHAVASLERRDTALAARVIARDDEVDRLYNRSIEALQEEMQNDAGLVRAGTLMLFVLTSLERVGDRAQNIAWHTKEMLGTA